MVAGDTKYLEAERCYVPSGKAPLGGQPGSGAGLARQFAGVAVGGEQVLQQLRLLQRPVGRGGGAVDQAAEVAVGALPIPQLEGVYELGVLGQAPDPPLRFLAIHQSPTP